MLGALGLRRGEHDVASNHLLPVSLNLAEIGAADACLLRKLILAHAPLLSELRDPIFHGIHPLFVVFCLQLSTILVEYTRPDKSGPSLRS